MRLLGHGGVPVPGRILGRAIGTVAGLDLANIVDGIAIAIRQVAVPEQRRRLRGGGDHGRGQGVRGETGGGVGHADNRSRESQSLVATVVIRTDTLIASDCARHGTSTSS